MAHTQPTHCRFAMSKAGFQRVAPSPEGQRPVSRKALSHGGSRERSGRGEFFAVPQDWSHLDKSRKRQCGQQKPTTLLNLNHILRGVPQKSSYRARRLGPSGAPPLPRRCRCPSLPPAAAPRCPPLPCRCPFAASSQAPCAGRLLTAALRCRLIGFSSHYILCSPSTLLPRRWRFPSRGNFFHFPPCGGTEFLL